MSAIVTAAHAITCPELLHRIAQGLLIYGFVFVLKIHKKTLYHSLLDSHMYSARKENFRPCTKGSRHLSSRSPALAYCPYSTASAIDESVLVSWFKQKNPLGLLLVIALFERLWLPSSIGSVSLALGTAVAWWPLDGWMDSSQADSI